MLKLPFRMHLMLTSRTVCRNELFYKINCFLKKISLISLGVHVSNQALGVLFAFAGICSLVMNHGYAYVHCLYLDFYVPWFTGKQFVLIAFVFRDSFPLCVGESLSGGCIVGAVVLFLMLSILVLFLIFFDVFCCFDGRQALQ